MKEDEHSKSQKPEDTSTTSLLESQSADSHHAIHENGHQGVSTQTGQVEQAPNELAASLEAGPIERLHLLTLLKDMTNRLGGLEATLSQPGNSEGKSRSQFSLELARILLGGWPAFGFIFLILFYFPLRDALMAIPDRVKTADEIQLPGVSLKSTIKKVAASQGLEGLGETIPKLSSPAIELLLRAPRRGESLVSFTNADDRNHYSAINFPSEPVRKALSELQGKGLIELEGGFGKSGTLDGTNLEGMWSELKKRYPGFEESSSGDDRISWKLSNPLPENTENSPLIMWMLTDTGSQAVDVILKAVSTQLLQAENTNSK
ncbi:MAG TPA: hypothetical protein VEY11_12935 [Pyrinomonadaceae bacterium]|nr:hypothetical protein [Pyrinomonadaceae bacterium]